MSPFMTKLLSWVFGRPETPEYNEPIRVKKDFSWFFPPKTLSDPLAWDKYWYEHISHHYDCYVDMMLDDGDLVDAMRRNGLKKILCIGSGISQEPRALAWAGFDVTVLDLSPFALRVSSEVDPPESYLAQLVGNREAGADGSLKFVAGDLSDSSYCPGPYDVIIDRRTLQLWPDDELPMALQTVVDRLAPRGLFFSHCHDGSASLREGPTHALGSWFKREGWEFWYGEGSLTNRAAWLTVSTG
jgi:hypothetical protein